MNRNEEGHFEEDRRYRQCNIEALWSLGIFLISCVLIGVVALVLGYNKPGDEIRLIAGFPAWYFYGVVIGGILTCVIVFPIVKFFFKEMSIQAVDEEDGRDDA